jgi:hypothetical protein
MSIRGLILKILMPQNQLWKRNSNQSSNSRDESFKVLRKPRVCHLHACMEEWGEQTRININICIRVIMVAHMQPIREAGERWLWHPGLGLNRIDRILISTSCNFFSGSSSPKNSEVKCAWPGAIWGWVTDREVLPGCARVSTKCAWKTCVGMWG